MGGEVDFVLDWAERVRRKNKNIRAKEIKKSSVKKKKVYLIFSFE